MQTLDLCFFWKKKTNEMRLSRFHSYKKDILCVFTVRFTGLRFFSVVHAQKREASHVYTISFPPTRENAQKTTFLRVDAPFWRVLSAWVVFQADVFKLS